MAKAKSKKITIEDALVPVEEQPYEVHGNWCWTYLSNIAQWGSGGTPSRKHPEYYGGNIPWIKTGELEDDFLYDSEERITEEAVANSSAKIFPENSVLIAMYGATIGKTAILAVPATTNQACACARCYDFIDNKYLFFYLRSQKDAFIRKGKGGAQPNISQDIIKNHVIPLPPFAEQQRIVGQIESLFSKLDEAKDKAQEVVDSFDSRRAAILAQAFSGKLTGKWRKKNAVENSWKIKNFDETAEIKSNLVDPSEYQDFPHIAPDNIEKRTGVLLEYHTIAEDGVTSGKHRFYPGQILYSKIRPHLSKVVTVDFDGLCSADMYPIEAKQNTRFLWYYMLSDEFLEAASSAGSRSVLPKINQKELSKIPVRITESEDEQGEVVRILDEIFSKENEARTLAETVIDKIDEVKKSVLAKAFRGELGTQDSSDEPAEELLKRVLSEAIVEEKKKSTTRKTKVDIDMNKDMLEAVKEAKKITPETLKQETGLEIDEFYEQLKKLIESGKVKEVRESGEVYLEVGNAD